MGSGMSPDKFAGRGRKMNVLLVILGLAVVVGLWFMSAYNRLVKLRNMKDEGWSGIDVQLKRRFDLIPNLIETVKGYAAHEQDTLQKTIAARSAITSAGDDTEARLKAENALTGTLRSLFALAEQYPDLKANTNFMHLQQQLSQIEDELQMSRRYYNGTARNLNNAAEQFPGVIVANMTGFKKAPYFEAAEGDRATPQVNFN